MRGPGLFVLHFLGPTPGFAGLGELARWAGALGHRALQLPVHDPRLLDLDAVAGSDMAAAAVREAMGGLEISELAAHRLGFLLARHPAYAASFPNPPPGVAEQDFAAERLRTAIAACRRLGVPRLVVVSGGLAWPWLYPWPIRDPAIFRDAFAELGRRWRPLLDAAGEAGVDLCFEPHPGCDLHDGTTFERFLEAVGGHPRCRLLYDPSHLWLQHMDPVGFVEAYGPRIAAFHVKDAVFRRGARSGVFGGYLPWAERPGQFRSPGRGEIPFPAVFAALRAQGYAGWAVLEWEDPEERDGAAAARAGAAFIARQLSP